MTNGPLILVPDPPAWPTLQRPIDMARELCNTVRPPGIPELEYSSMEHRGLYIDHRGPFLVESAQRVVASALARTLDRAACQTALTPKSCAGLVRQIL